MLFLEAGLRPEALHFPDYLLMEGHELEAHGRVPETPLIGAGMKTDIDLKTVRGDFTKVLATHGWKTTKMEIGRQSFRIQAAQKTETVEIRAVQGSGLTRIFILYRPAVKPAA